MGRWSKRRGRWAAVVACVLWGVAGSVGAEEPAAEPPPAQSGAGDATPSAEPSPTERASAEALALAQAGKPAEGVKVLDAALTASPDWADGRFLRAALRSKAAAALASEGPVRAKERVTLYTGAIEDLEAFLKTPAAADRKADVEAAIDDLRKKLVEAGRAAFEAKQRTAEAEKLPDTPTPLPPALATPPPSLSIEGIELHAQALEAERSGDSARQAAAWRAFDRDGVPAEVRALAKARAALLDLYALRDAARAETGARELAALRRLAKLSTIPRARKLAAIALFRKRYGALPALSKEADAVTREIDPFIELSERLDDLVRHGMGGELTKGSDAWSKSDLHSGFKSLSLEPESCVLRVMGFSQSSHRGRASSRSTYEQADWRSRIFLRRIAQASLIPKPLQPGHSRDFSASAIHAQPKGTDWFELRKSSIKTKRVAGGRIVDTTTQSEKVTSDLLLFGYSHRITSPLAASFQRAIEACGQESTQEGQDPWSQALSLTGTVMPPVTLAAQDGAATPPCKYDWTITRVRRDRCQLEHALVCGGTGGHNPKAGSVFRTVTNLTALGAARPVAGAKAPEGQLQAGAVLLGLASSAGKKASRGVTSAPVRWAERVAEANRGEATIPFASAQDAAKYQRLIEALAASCRADRDGDGVADMNDQCPDTAGHPENAGCPLTAGGPGPLPDAQRAVLAAKAAEEARKAAEEKQRLEAAAEAARLAAERRKLEEEERRRRAEARAKLRAEWLAQSQTREALRSSRALRRKLFGIPLILAGAGLAAGTLVYMFKGVGANNDVTNGVLPTGDAIRTRLADGATANSYAWGLGIGALGSFVAGTVALLLNRDPGALPKPAGLSLEVGRVGTGPALVLKGGF